MRMKNYLCASVLAAVATFGFNVSAGNVDANAARQAANSFLKQHASGRMMAPAMSDLHLTHAEASVVGHGANAYYAFNIQGGGFIIIAGDDRASQVLGYSDKGRLDYNRLPDNFKALMRGYKEEVEYLQKHPELNVTPALRATSGSGVDPLIKSTWGQEMPYYLQCPVYNGEYCVVGCVATAMAQVMYYWKYPTSCQGVNSYYCYDINQTIPALPSASFNYNKMLPSYCHWDWDNSQLVQDTYTDEQAQEVAKLSRYCGQAVNMGYSPEGSGAYVSSQMSAMKDFGYSSDIEDISRSNWWGQEYYTTAEWEALVKAELDKRRPILYSATDPAAGGHAFICDGYNSDGLLHFNFGWYGTCDGWYVSTALNMTHRDGDDLKFNSDHEILLGVVPPTYCIVSAEGLEVSGDLFVLGENMSIQASGINIMTTNDNINLIFNLLNSQGRLMASSPAILVTLSDFEQGSTISNELTLPTTLAEGTYSLQLHHYQGLSRITNPSDCETGELNVVGHLAKYNAPFTIDDVTTTIDYLLKGSHSGLTIDDVTALIDALLRAGR